LNLAESQQDTQNHLLGAWHSQGPLLAFSTFLPALALKDGLLTIFYMSSSLRTEWARSVLVPTVEGQKAKPKRSSRKRRGPDEEKRGGPDPRRGAGN
jgi:hypothetical protein